MKDIRNENEELKKMLKDMYQVHISTLDNQHHGGSGQHEPNFEVESTDQGFDQIDIHIDEKTGMTKTKYKRSRSKLEKHKKSKNSIHNLNPQVIGDTRDSRKPIGYGTFGAKNHQLTPMEEYNVNEIPKMQKNRKNMPLAPSNDSQFINQNVQSQIELEKAKSLLSEQNSRLQEDLEDAVSELKEFKLLQKAKLDKEFIQKTAQWKESYDRKVKQEFQKEMAEMAKSYEIQMKQMKKDHKKEIAELKDCFQSLVKEQDNIIARDKVSPFFIFSSKFVLIFLESFE